MPSYTELAGLSNKYPTSLVFNYPIITMQLFIYLHIYIPILYNLRKYSIYVCVCVCVCVYIYILTLYAFQKMSCIYIKLKDIIYI